MQLMLISNCENRILYLLKNTFYEWKPKQVHFLLYNNHSEYCQVALFVQYFVEIIKNMHANIQCCFSQGCLCISCYGNVSTLGPTENALIIVGIWNFPSKEATFNV